MAGSWMFLTFNINKTPYEKLDAQATLTFYLLDAQATSFLIHVSFPFPTQSVRLPLVTYPSMCRTCMTYRAPCFSISHQVLPTQPLSREAEDFSKGDKHSKYVSLLTYLACNQLLIIRKLIFKHVKTKNALLVVNSLIKTKQ